MNLSSTTSSNALSCALRCYVPDLPGCVATGATVEEAERLIREAIEIHLAGMREDGTPIPPPSSRVDYLEVAALQSLEDPRAWKKLCARGA